MQPWVTSLVSFILHLSHVQTAPPRPLGFSTLAANIRLHRSCFVTLTFLNGPARIISSMFSAFSDHVKISHRQNIHMSHVTVTLLSELQN